MSQYGYPNGYPGNDGTNRGAYTSSSSSARPGYARPMNPGYSAAPVKPVVVNANRSTTSLPLNSGKSVNGLSGNSNSSSPVNGNSTNTHGNLQTLESEIPDTLDTLRELRAVLTRICHEEEFSQDTVALLSNLRNTLHDSHTRIDDNGSQHGRDTLQHVTIPGTNVNVETYLTNNTKTTGMFPQGSITLIAKKYINTPQHLHIDTQPQNTDITNSSDTYKTQAIQTHATASQFSSLYISNNNIQNNHMTHNHTAHHNNTVQNQNVPVVSSTSQLYKTHKLATFASHQFHEKLQAMFPSLQPSVDHATERLQARFDPAPALAKVLPGMYAGLTDVEAGVSIPKSDTNYLPSVFEAYLQRIYPKADIPIHENTLTTHEKSMISILFMASQVRTVYPMCVCFLLYTRSSNLKAVQMIQIPKISPSLFATQNLNLLKTLLSKLETSAMIPSSLSIHHPNRYNIRIPLKVHTHIDTPTIYHTLAMLEMQAPIVYGYDESPIQLYGKQSIYSTCQQLTRKMKKQYTKLQLYPESHVFVNKHVKSRYISLWSFL